MGKIYDIWEVAQCMTGMVALDIDSSERAGYKIYRGSRGYICDLGDRLEVNLYYGKTVNLWRA